MEGFEKEKQDGWAVFLQNCGPTITEKEKNMLAKEKPDPKLFPYTKLKQSNQSLRVTPSTLGDHHFFALLGWNPQAIKTTAILRKGNKNLRLVNLYHIIVE